MRGMLLRVAMQQEDVIVRMDKGSRQPLATELSEGKGKERALDASD